MTKHDADVGTEQTEVLAPTGQLDGGHGRRSHGCEVEPIDPHTQHVGVFGAKGQLEHNVLQVFGHADQMRDAYVGLADAVGYLEASADAAGCVIQVGVKRFSCHVPMIAGEDDPCPAM